MREYTIIEKMPESSIELIVPVIRDLQDSILYPEGITKVIRAAITIGRVGNNSCGGNKARTGRLFTKETPDIIRQQ